MPPLDSAAPQPVYTAAAALCTFALCTLHFALGFHREQYADDMTLPAKYGGIDYFLTSTTNPSRPDIAANASISHWMNSPNVTPIFTAEFLI